MPVTLEAPPIAAGKTDAGTEVLRCLGAVPFLLRIRNGKLDPEFVGKGLVELLGVAGSARFADGWLEPWIHPHDAATAVPDYASLSAGHEVIRHLRVGQAHGDYRWLRQSCRLLGEGSADDYQIAGLLSEGSQSQRLEEQQRQHQALIQLAADWYWEQDTQLRYTRVSAGFESITGLPVDSILGRTRREMGLEKDDAGIDWVTHQRGLDAHMSFRNFDYLGRHAGSQADPHGRRPIWLRDSGQAKFDDEGRFLGYFGVTSLIGDPKRTEQAAQGHPAHLQTVLDRLPWAVLVLDDKLNSVYQNERFEEVFDLPYGYPEHGTPIKEIARMIASKGGYGKGDSHAKVQSHIEDISAFTAHAIELRPAGGGTVTLSGSPVLVQNAPAGFVLLQTEPAERFEQPDRRKVYLEGRPIPKDATNAPLAERRRAEDEDRRGEAGAEHRKYMEMARQIERHFSAIFYQAPMPLAVVEMSAGNPVLLVSDAWLSQFGQTRSETIGTDGLALPFLKSAADREKVVGLVERRSRFSDVEVEYLRADSVALRWGRCSGRFFNRSDRTYLILLLEDITEQKQAAEAMREFNTRLERSVSDRTDALQRALNDLGMVIENLEETQDELVRSKKLAALGGMVAGIAHELNTPIGNSLMVASHLVKATSSMGEAVKTGLRRSILDEYLADNAITADVLVRNLNKAAELVSSFKQVAVDQTSSKRRSFNLAEMVAETVTTLGPSLRKTPYLVEQNVAKDIKMDSYPGPLGQVLTNLINNGILHGFDGSPSGRISIEGDLSETPGHIVLRIKDNGAGIPDTVLPHIFDPFFTTKRGSGGSGLGLHIVHNMVTRILSGTISVESEPGKGSCFTLHLAMAAAAQDDGTT